MITGEQVYLPAYTGGQSKLTVEGSEYHHLARVRRYNQGDQIWVINGKGLAALTRIVHLTDSSLSLEILEEERHRGEIKKELTLAIANLKGDHLNLITEKCTELGVSTIIPLLTDHTIKKGLNKNRLERIAISAMKQSRRSKLPNIADLTRFSDFVKSQQEALHLFCHGEEKSLNVMDAIPLINAAEKVVIWIGPEGDWSKDEIDLASVSDYTFTGLGPRRLRAETAAIHAVGLVSTLLQDPA